MLTMSTFEIAVGEMQPLFEGIAPEIAAFISSDQRLVEARAVEGCVDRTVVGELDPTGRLAISRYTGFSPPGLGERLASKGRFDPADPEQTRVLAHAVRKTLAVGWLFACSADAPMVDRDERDIWAFWSSSIRDELSNIVDPKLARMIHSAGRDVLIADLKRAGMTYALGGSKLHQIGYHLAQGGCYLRMTQTEEMTNESFAELAYLGNSERWAWGDYPV
jgi:hypothetical protein